MSGESGAPRGARGFPDALVLAPILVVAAAARLWEAWRTPLWSDEIFTLMVARLELPALMRALAGDMHPALQFLLEHAWIRLGGEGELWLKSLSVLAGLATVAALYGLTRDLFGRGTAALAALLLALHRTHVYYSQEARSYALLWMLYVLAAWMAWRWVERARARDAVAFVLAAAAALYTHYQAGLVLACLGAWGVFALRATPRRIVSWIVLHLVVALLFAPQLPTFVAQWLRLSHEHWVSPVSWSLFLSVMRMWSFGTLTAAVPLTVLALAPLARAGWRRAATLALTLSVIPMLLACGLHRLGAQLFTDRYMMFALPLWCTLIAAGLAMVPWPRLRAALALAVVVLVAARTLVQRPPLPEAVDQARALAWLRPQVGPGDLLVCGDTHSFFFLGYHAPGLGRQVLVLADPHLPYYEGAQFIPERARVRLASWDSLTAGGRWFGMHARHGGIDTRPIRLRMLESARRAEGFGDVTAVASR